MVADNARERNVSYDNDWAIGYLVDLVRITMLEDYKEGASIFSHVRCTSLTTRLKVVFPSYRLTLVFITSARETS